MNSAAITDRPDSGNGKISPEHLHTFCGYHADYYLARFEELAQHNSGGISLNWAAVLGGPYWAVGRGLWHLFWTSYLVEVIFLGALLAENNSLLTTGLLLLIVLGNRLGLGLVANRSYWHAFCGWRIGSRAMHRFEWQRLLVVSALALPSALLAIAGVGNIALSPHVLEFPNSSAMSSHTQIAINQAIEWASAEWGPLFDGITTSVRWVLDHIEQILLGIPWPAIVAMLGLLAWRTGGMRLLALSLLIAGYLGLFGYWQKAISTMSLVAASVSICAFFGVPLGILCAKYRRINRIAEPVMDMMQTMPSFVYLLPAIAFFSIGKPPAILATVVFAMPPVIKLTALGIRQIPENVKEAMLAFGASPWQLLVKAELPMAIPSIMAGVNQSIMMSLSMVVVGALIGAGGLGYDVLTALQQMDNGSGILAGVAIVLCAMLLDSLIQGKKPQH